MTFPGKCVREFIWAVSLGSASDQKERKLARKIKGHRKRPEQEVRLQAWLVVASREKPYCAISVQKFWPGSGYQV